MIYAHTTSNSIFAANTSPSVLTEKLPPQASVKLFAIERPRPLPSVVRDLSPRVNPVSYTHLTLPTKA